MTALVCAAGFLATVQDLGRTGFRSSGVALGGALDAHALRVANALVGNEDSAAGVEATLGTLRLRFSDQRLIAWCGGAFAVQLGGENLPPGHAALVEANEEIVLTAPKNGARAWLAISGGVAVPLILGSCSTDLGGNFGGLEGRALRDGDRFSLGEQSPSVAQRIPPGRRIAEWSAPVEWAASSSRVPVLRFLLGADWSCFTRDAQISLAQESFTVTPLSDRMAARLDGPLLCRDSSDELQSEAVAPGTVQVPPDGQPILLLGDCQTIGGYPKIAHVITVDLPIAAQLHAGAAVRFQEVPLAHAGALLLERENDFARFRVGISLRVS
jgi:antagonist of KipI